jgi:hypothetical protein
VTRDAAISIALLALIALVFIMLLGRHGRAANVQASADSGLELTSARNAAACALIDGNSSRE